MVSWDDAEDAFPQAEESQAFSPAGLRHPAGARAVTAAIPLPQVFGFRPLGSQC